ncbi:exonuclease domain-containing protein [Photobacterium galatheae]|uniref:Exonuclease domain-containing protein n=1 Tax=Photobacterium galatheae TaxID=1654360 RepID=A0A066RKR6_9GAMM|nr:exonuclease domain-containing protein [Photobacterium galatheae]KDM90944.1 hypothetical protein EA58_14405 [Photobacterium galatheae]MCM0149092.1 3'-5' exoribonuclease [Photobacterium galatheae]
MCKKFERSPARTLCLDLEFSYGKKKNERVDIYEIGIVAVDEFGKEVGSFQTHVKPEYFCPTTLDFLSLHESDFVSAPDLKKAMRMMNDFVSQQAVLSPGDLKWCSWGKRDKEILSTKAGMVSLPNGHKLTKSPYFDAQYQFYRNVPSARLRHSLREVVEDFCGDYIENHHSALDDARALAKIVKTYCI